MPQRDVTLVRQAQAGDPEAFAVLVERYGPLVRGLVLEVARQHDEADDLSQEVFTRAYQQLASLRKPGKFASWLGQIASRVAVDWLRHQRAEAHAVRASNDRLLRVHLPSQDVALEAREAVDLLWDALDRLTPEYRRVAVLFYLEGCVQADISRFLGISGATVRWRLARARRGLEEGLIELLSREAAQRPRSTRQLRDKILSGMPLVAFFRPPPPTSWMARWGLRGLAVLGCAGILGLAGLVYQDYQDLAKGEEPERAGELGGFRVRREEVELPELSVLADLSKLRDLEMIHCWTQDVSSLGQLTGLTRLVLQDDEISDISPLAGLTRLDDLQLSGNRISDISPLAGMSRLHTLYLEKNQIQDISVIAGFPEMKWLELSENRIEDISSLMELSRLTRVEIQDNPLNEYSRDVLVPALQESGVTVIF